MNKKTQKKIDELLEASKKEPKKKDLPCDIHPAGGCGEVICGRCGRYKFAKTPCGFCFTSYEANLHPEDAESERDGIGSGRRRLRRFVEENREALEHLILEYGDANAMERLELLREKFWSVSE